MVIFIVILLVWGYSCVLVCNDVLVDIGVILFLVLVGFVLVLLVVMYCL